MRRPRKNATVLGERQRNAWTYDSYASVPFGRIRRYGLTAPYMYVGEYWGAPGDLEKELGREPTLSESLDRPLCGPYRKTLRQAIDDVERQRHAALERIARMAAPELLP
jgi:hypothetical protein